LLTAVPINDTEENDDAYTIFFLSRYRLNGKTNIYLGLGQGEDDDVSAPQLTLNFYDQVWYQASESRSVRFEF
jgi:hypothetical protein